MKAGILAEPVLVGREQELAELEHHLKSATEGKGTTVFVSGEAGAGKTRLINEFLNIAKKEEITTLLGWCLSNAAIPYFPFVEAFGPDLPAIQKEIGSISSKQIGMRSWLSDPYSTGERGKSKVLTPQVWKDQAFTAVTQDLLFISSVKPVVLVLEDMHWADSASLALLHYISRALVSERVLILVTFRSEELRSNVEGRPHPLVETIHLMGREGLFKEIRLPNLDRDNVRRIAESMLGDKVDLELVEKLSEESRGNPLFVVELLKMLSERGELNLEHGKWRLSVDKLGVPSKVKEIILRRIGSMRTDQRRILDVASVIGEKFDPGLIGAVLSKDRLEILETLNDILQSTSIVSVEEDFYRFDHAKSRGVLYEEISLPLKQEYHARIADQIENASQNIKEALNNDLAYHYAQAGNEEKSVKYSLAAGQDALARFSNTEAIKHFKIVLETVADIQEYKTKRSVALEGLGDAYYACCMFEEAAKTFESLASSETGALKARAYRKEMGALWFMEYDTSRLMELVKKAEKHVASDRLESARVLWYRGAALFRLGDMKASLRDHEEALQIFKEEYSLPDVAQLLSTTGITRVWFDLGPKKGLGEQQRSIALYQELGDARGEIIATLHRNTCFRALGLIQELVDAYTNILEIGEKIGDFETLAQASMQMTYKFEFLEMFEEAITLTLKALEYSQKTDTKRLQSEIYARLAWQYARIGDLKQAKDYYGMLMKMPPEILSYEMNSPFAVLAEAVMFAAENQWKEANQRFLEVLEISKTGFWAHTGFEFFARMYYVWALGLQGRTEEVKILVEENWKRWTKNEERFEHADLQADLMMRRKVMVDEEVEMRLDIVNVGRGSGSIIKVEGLIPSDGFKVTALPSYCCLKNGDLEVGGREIGAFQVETIKLNVQAVKPGVFTLSPQVEYTTDSEGAKTCKPKPIKIAVNPVLSKPEEEEVAGTAPAKIEFKSENAQKAFNFLIHAFIEDYFRRRLPMEGSGWRTLMDIVKQAHVSQYSMYRSSGRRGLALSELERLGVVEVRIFLGERGRGGKISKLRVSYDRENVRGYIDQCV